MLSHEWTNKRLAVASTMPADRWNASRSFPSVNYRTTLCLAVCFSRKLSCIWNVVFADHITDVSKVIKDIELCGLTILYAVEQDCPQMMLQIHYYVNLPKPENYYISIAGMMNVDIWWDIFKQFLRCKDHCFWMHTELCIGSKTSQCLSIKHSPVVLERWQCASTWGVIISTYPQALSVKLEKVQELANQGCCLDSCHSVQVYWIS